MVEKIVFILMLIIAVGGGIFGGIFEFGGKKNTPGEKTDSGEKEEEK